MSKRFGIATGMLRHVWINAAGEQDPLDLVSRIAELPWRDRQKALNACDVDIDTAGKNGMREEIFKILAGLPEDVVTTEQLVRFVAPADGRIPDAAATRKGILQLGSGDERLAKVKAMLLGMAISSKTPDEIANEIQAMPKSIGEEVLWAAFKRRNAADCCLKCAEVSARWYLQCPRNSRSTVAKWRPMPITGAPC